MKPYMFYANHYKEDKGEYKLHYELFYRKMGTKILDVGCSTGNFLMHCSKESCGVDGDEESIKAAKKRGLNAELINLDEEKLPYPDNEFDAVNFISVIEHLKNPLNTLLEIRRVLKPNGKLFIRAKNVEKWKWKYWNNYNQHTVINKESMKQFLMVAGFENFEIKYIDRGTPLGLKMLNLGISSNFIKKWSLLYGSIVKKYVFAEVSNEK